MTKPSASSTPCCVLAVLLLAGCVKAADPKPSQFEELCVAYGGVEAVYRHESETPHRTQITYTADCKDGSAVSRTVTRRVK